ncbi:CocE/NonD family hydrolase [Nocardia sp. 2]|uniref:CocE/NonD family hydrolase n=1 Tax=Nocardia acididurans TaxID=2802282 RepID=A0ABS1LZA7_9NOCA|nr:CocE/NonD family hydrolase [Nocardia acididurans]MBL1073753.1 CocE/NonD family hydrolase [Nocardia acididurans]
MAHPHDLSRTSALPDRSAPLPPNARFPLGPVVYPRVRVQRGVGIRLSDGTILSADITRPADRDGAPVTTPLPTIITITPYNKTLMTRADPLIDAVTAAGPWVYRLVQPSAHGRAGGREMVRALGGGALEAIRANRTAISRGYVHVSVDVRGTGTSTGRLQLMSEREQRDHLEVLAWVRQQPWCNGDLAMTGISYLAIAALLTAGHRPEGLKAIFAIVGSEDGTRDLILTGGMQSAFTPFWLLAVNGTKWLPSVPGLLKSGAALRFLRDRLTSPFTRGGDVVGAMLDENHPEHFYGADARARRPRLEDITAATWIQAGWHDVFARSVPGLHNRLDLPGGAAQLVVEDSYHVGPGTGFGTDDHPQRLDELQCAFFDRWVKGIDNGIDEYGPVTVRQLGGGWVSRDAYPHPAARVHRLFLSAESSGAAPHAGADCSLRPDPGRRSRRISLPRKRPPIASQTSSWINMGLTTLLGRDWSIDDRGYESAAVTFTGAPLPEDLVISGPLNLHLRVVTTGADAFWATTVCDVAPDGTSTVIARGALRSTRRAVDESASRYVDGELVGAEHPLTPESVLPVAPGVPHELDIDTTATEALLRAGHRLRVTVTRGSWPRYFVTPSVARLHKDQSIVLDPRHPSTLTFLATLSTAAPAEELPA